MRLHSATSGRARRLGPAMTRAAALAVTIAGCSSANGTGTQPPASQPAAAPTSAPASSAPAAAAATSSDGLSGRWSGQYDGSYQGTFTLRWRQSGSRLSGTIRLSAPAGGPIAIHGTVLGGAIRFGTVGATAITYSGSVSGNSMSGTYQVHGGGGGPWKATKA